MVKNNFPEKREQRGDPGPHFLVRFFRVHHLGCPVIMHKVQDSTTHLGIGNPLVGCNCIYSVLTGWQSVNVTWRGLVAIVGRVSALLVLKCTATTAKRCRPADLQTYRGCHITSPSSCTVNVCFVVRHMQTTWLTGGLSVSGCRLHLHQ